MAEVVCLGILVADVLARPVDRYPDPGKLVLCDQLQLSIGGCAANTGIGLQKLGVPTAVEGKVGGDIFGDFVCNTLKMHDVDTRGVVVAEDGIPTSATMVMIRGDNGERSFIHSMGANAALTADDINWELIEGAKLLHIAGHFLLRNLDGTPCAEVLKRARSMGIKTALDTAGPSEYQQMELLRPALPYVDYFVPSYAEALRCVESMGVAAGGVKSTPEAVARVFQEEGVGVVALKMGEGGSYIRAGDEEWKIPAFRVQAVDATGAGDAFAAGFLAGVVNGFDLETTGKLANAAGACCVTDIGTIAGIRSLDETLAFIADQTKNGWHK